MRVAIVPAAALLVTGCTWVHQQLPWTAPPPPAAVAPKPEPAPTPKPRARMERPAAPASVAQVRDEPPVAAAQTEPPVDNAARCHTMADNRADDAKGLGASSADQTKMRDDTFHDCMQQSVK